MPAVTPPPDLARHLAPLELRAAGGGTVRLGSLWAERTAVLVHLRHFGWLFCREAVTQVRDVEDELAEMGADVAAIGTGGLHYAEDFRSSHGLGFPVLVDPDLVSYRAVGAGRGTVRGMASLSTVRGGARAILRGNVQGRSGSHSLMLGATHAIGPGGHVILAWRNADYADNVPMPTLLAALRRGVE